MYLAELAKRLQSGRFYAGNAALGPKETHNDNWAWLRTLRRGCVRFCLAPGPLITLAFARQMALRVVGPVGGGTNESDSFIAGALCPSPPCNTALNSAGRGLGPIKEGLKGASSSCPYKTK